MKRLNNWKSITFFIAIFRIIIIFCHGMMLYALPNSHNASNDSPIIRITLIDKREELKLPEYQLPERLSLCFDAKKECLFKFYESDKRSDAPRVVQVGNFYRGENYITIPAGRFFLTPGTINYSFILEVKVEEQTFKKTLNLEVTFNSKFEKKKEKNPSADHQNRKNSTARDTIATKSGKEKKDLLEPRYYELTMVFGKSIIETVVKAVDPLEALSRITEKEPYRIEFDPAYPVPGSNPSEHAATISPLTLVGIGYSLIKKKIKAKKERRRRKRLRKKVIIAGTFFTPTTIGGKKPVELRIKLSTAPLEQSAKK
jgi:hypothetical protein